MVGSLAARQLAPVVEQFTECVARARQPSVSLDSLVVVLMVTAARSALVAAHVRTWLSSVRALLVSDRHVDEQWGLVNTSRRRVVVLPSRGCRNSDLYSTAMALGNATFPDYEWMLFTEDDTVFVLHNVLRFLSLFDAAEPVWLSAHGCEASYRPLGCVRTTASSRLLANNLSRTWPDRPRLQTLDAPYVVIDQHGRRVSRKTDSPPSYGVTSNCGGLGCIFSRGLLHSLRPEALRRPQCTQCAVGHADIQASHCLFTASGVGPYGVPAFSWGRGAQQAHTALLGAFPACAAPCATPRCVLRCAESTGIFGVFSMHLRSQWGKSFGRGALPATVEDVHKASERVGAALARAEALGAIDASADKARRRVCCHLVTADLPMCENGCTPWRNATRRHQAWCASLTVPRTMHSSRRPLLSV